MSRAHLDREKLGMALRTAFTVLEDAENVTIEVRTRGAAGGEVTTVLSIDL